MSAATPRMSTGPVRPTPVPALEVVVTFIAVAVFAGVIFLTSPPPDMVPDGAIPWAKDSLLHALTTALAFEFKIPTPFGAAIKSLVGGIGAAILILVVAVGLFLKKRDRVRTAVWAEEPQAVESVGKQHIHPQRAAEYLAIGVVMISLGSCLIAIDRRSALGGTVLLASHLAWAFMLRYGLGRRSTCACAAGLSVVLLLCAGLGIWYFYGRNPNMRLGYPVGNPLFLSACLIPGMLIAVAWGVRGVARWPTAPAAAVCTLLSAAASAGIIGWAMYLTEARGTALGLAAGFAVLIFVAVRGKTQRMVVVAATTVIAIVGYASVLQPLIDARGDTVRSRFYTWEYALQLTTAAPILGHGQGGYAYLADGRAVQQVQDDPWALKDRIAHAHNEWLEALADIGSFGVVALGGVLCMTFLAGIRRADQLDDPTQRWLLIGLLAALAAMVVEESTNVALRIAGFPTVFYGVIGMIWALSAPAPRATGKPGGLTLAALLTAAAVGGGVFIGAAHVWDFRAARALHDYAAQLHQRHFDAGLATVDLAASHRLSPQRRLSGTLAQGGAHLFVAAARYEDLLRVREQLQNTEGVRTGLEAAARDYFELAIGHAQTAIDIVESITARVGPAIGAHLIIGDAHDLVGRCAALVGNVTESLSRNQAAAQAYRIEYQRQPHNRNITWRVFELSQDLEPAQFLEMMGPAMRFLDIDDRFLGMVDQLAQQPGFDAMLTERVADALAAADGEVSDQPHPCETLRIAAWVASFRRDYTGAVVLGTAAVGLADAQAEFFPATPAICRRELAHYTYLANPDNAERAVAIARAGHDLVPRAYECRPIARQIEQRLGMYLLARGTPGDEELAVRTWLGVSPPPEQFTVRLAELYQVLCTEVLQFISPEHWPAAIDDHVQRLTALAPDSPTPPLLAARMAFERQRPDEGLALLRRARALGADAGHITGSRSWLEQRYPEHHELRLFMEELAVPTESSRPPE